MANNKKYVSLSKLSTFLDNLKNIFATKTEVAGKADSSHSHTVSQISDLTATATELNYVDGVTSAIQAQLDSKAASTHPHAASEITSGTLSSDRLPTVPIAKGGTGATTSAQALKNLGLTATATELNKLDGVTATTTELNYVDGVTSNIQTQLDDKVPTSRTINGKALTANISLSSLDVNADPSGSASAALADAYSYTNVVTGGVYADAKKYTDDSIANMELITVDDIDTICGASIQVATASEVTF